MEIIDLVVGWDTVGVDEEEAARRGCGCVFAAGGRARPLFVGLVGDRVGYIPDGAHARWVADQAGCRPINGWEDVGCRRRLNPERPGGK